jgi:hypothetical protein
MALTNFILTVVGVGAAVMLLRKDVKQSATIFRRNVRHIRNWLEEESAAAAKYAPLSPCLLCSRRLASIYLVVSAPRSSAVAVDLVTGPARIGLDLT